MSSPHAAKAQYPGGGGGYPGSGGSYTVAYSGGQITEQYGNNAPSSTNYSLLSGNYGGGGYVDSFPSTVTTTGAITTTLTWNNGGNANNLPPSQIVLQKNCTVSWAGNPAETINGIPYPAASGNCSNPLGGSATPDNPGPGDFWQHTSYTEVSNPGASYQFTTDPSATASTAGPQSNINVQYSVDVNIPTVALAGTTLVTGSQEALCGQQIEATFSGLPSGSVITQWTWAVNGATGLLKNWDFNAPGDGKPTQAIQMASTDLSGTTPTVPPLYFYDFKKESPVTVTCTVNLVFPDGSTGTVAPISPSVGLQDPAANWTIDQVPDDLISPTGSPPGPPAGTTPGSFTDFKTSMWNNQWWDPVTLTDPSGFSGGTGGFAQIANLSRTVIGNDQNGNAYTVVASPSSGLDSGYCYPFGYTDNPDYWFDDPDGTNPARTGQRYGGGGYQWSISGVGDSGDSPIQDFFATSYGQTIPNMTWTSASASDGFSTYLMFMPPSAGLGTIWVPVQEYNWNWSGQATYSTSAPAPNTWTVTLSPTPSAQPVSGIAPPSWSLPIVPSPLTYQEQQ